ncbi:MAG TPA: BNR-4 repeat-containing protein [Vicinamibacteria bacterium]|nr:BNR-4 repeat-containing protein [Vicinamibacteria bacterium]
MAERRLAGRLFVAALLSAMAVSLPAQQPGPPPEAGRGGASPLAAPVVLNDDGGWCWFQDERALVVGDRLVFGSVAAGRSDASRRGTVEVTSVVLATGATTRFRLSATPVERAGRYDDHDTPAFVVRGDGRLLAVWAGHGYDNRILSRVSLRPGDATGWGDERAFVPSPSSSVTYSNLHRLAGERGRIYDFFRGLDNRFKPSMAWSDDEGESFRSGGVVIDVPATFRHRPYVKYASDGQATVHLAYTEGHPRNFDNSLYHAYYRDGVLHRSDGSVIRPLAEGLRDPVEGTRVFQGDPANVAWVIDLELDAQGRPFVAYSVQKDSAGLPQGQGGSDHRYRLARWTGKAWNDREIASAGTRLYAGEDDYTGGVALVPGDPTRVLVSTDADPTTGAPLVSAADGKRHWEIFRGTTPDDGLTWQWQAVTRDSTADNLRPIVPRSDARDELLLWLRGRYRSYTDYDLEVVGLLP